MRRHSYRVLPGTAYRCCRLHRTGCGRRGDAVIVYASGRAASGCRHTGLAQVEPQADICGRMAQSSIGRTGSVEDRQTSLAIRGGKNEGALPVRRCFSHRMAGVSDREPEESGGRGAIGRERAWTRRYRFPIGGADSRRRVIDLGINESHYPRCAWRQWPWRSRPPGPVRDGG